MEFAEQSRQGQPMTATDLASLIATRKGKRSYERLAQDCGGVMSGARLQQLANGPLAHFSEPKVIEGLARGLDVTVTTVVTAMAASVGLDVRYGADPSALVIGSAGNLPASARETVIGVARELLTAYQVTTLEGEDRDDSPMYQAPVSGATKDDVELAADPITADDGLTGKQRLTSAQDDDAERGDEIPPDDGPPA